MEKMTKLFEIRECGIRSSNEILEYFIRIIFILGFVTDAFLNGIFYNLTLNLQKHQESVCDKIPRVLSIGVAQMHSAV